MKGFRGLCFKFGAVSDVPYPRFASVEPCGYLFVSEAFIDEGLDLMDLLGCVSSSQIHLIYRDSDIKSCFAFAINLTCARAPGYQIAF